MRSDKTLYFFLTGYADFRKRLGNMVVASSKQGVPVTADDLVIFMNLCLKNAVDVNNVGYIFRELVVL